MWADPGSEWLLLLDVHALKPLKVVEIVVMVTASLSSRDQWLPIRHKISKWPRKKHPKAKLFNQTSYLEVTGSNPASAVFSSQFIRCFFQVQYKVARHWRIIWLFWKKRWQDSLVKECSDYHTGQGGRWLKYWSWLFLNDDWDVSCSFLNVWCFLWKYQKKNK